MNRLAVLLIALLCACEAQLPKKYLHVKGVYKCDFKPVTGESVLILHRSTPVIRKTFLQSRNSRHFTFVSEVPVPDRWEKIAETYTDEQGNYELHASDEVCTDGCAGSGEKGFYVQLTHHCLNPHPHNTTVEIPKENQGDSENDVKLFKHDFLIDHDQ